MLHLVTYLNDVELILRIGSIGNGFLWWSFIWANRFKPLPQSALLADCSDSSLETPEGWTLQKTPNPSAKIWEKKTIHSMKLTNIPFKRFVEKLICLFQKSSVIFCQKGTHKQNSLRKILMFFDIWHLYWHIVTWPINRVSAHSPCSLVPSVARTVEAIEVMEAMAPKMERPVPHAALASSGSTWDDSTTNHRGATEKKKNGLTPYFPLFFSGCRDPYIYSWFIIYHHNPLNIP